MIFKYTPYNNIEAWCDIEIYQRGPTTVVIMTEMPDNPGMSVTNACEFIVTQMLRAYPLDPGRCIWIEHYPERYPAIEETFDLVTFHWRQGVEASAPHWHPVTREWVEELVGREIP